MEPLSTIILGAVLPAAMDLVKSAGGAIGRKFGGLSVDDEIKLKNADMSRLEALAKLDNPVGTPSQWVVDLRASFRYISAGVIILVGACIVGVGVLAKYNNPELDAQLVNQIIALGVETAGTPFSFIFGERMWANFKGTFK